MDDPDTSRQNGGSVVEGRDSGSKKRSVRGGIAGRKDYARDKLTNGSKTLPDTDGRLRIARRFRDIAAAILVDQGGADPFLEEQLKTQLLIEACDKAGQPSTIRMQPGYDHSYYFISTFMPEHIAWHSARLGGAATENQLA